MMDEGNEWYRGFLEGDETCFEKLVIRYRNGMIDFINQIVNDYHFSEEITEDVFVLLYVKKPQFSPVAGFKTWLYTIAKNKARNFVRKKSRHPALELSSDISCPELSDQILHDIYMEERKVLLHKALDELTADYRLVLHLHYFDDFSVNEIATILKKKPRAVSDALFNAKRTLRGIIMKGEKYEILRRNTQLYK